MKTNFKKGFAPLISLILVTLLSIGAGYFGSEIRQNQIRRETEEATLGAFNPTGGGTYRLKNSISSTASSITLTSFKEPVSQTPYTMTYLNTTIMYGTIEPLNPDKSEFVSFTGITQNSDGTATLTGVSRGLARSYPYTASTTHAQTHPGQSIFILSDTPQLFNTYLNAADTETITGDWTYASTSAPSYDARWNIATSSLDLVYADWVGDNYLEHASTSARTLAGLYTFSQVPTFNGLLSIASSTFASTLNVLYSTASSSAASVGYVSDVVSAGGVDANETTKGLVEEATVAEINSKSATGGTGAKLIMTPEKFAVSRFASSTQYFATSSTPVNLYILNVPMLAGDVMKVWGAVTVNCFTDTSTLKVRPTNYSASTTIYSFTCGGDNNQKSQALLGSWTATTTSSVNVGLESSNAHADGWQSLMVEVTGHP